MTIEFESQTLEGEHKNTIEIEKGQISVKFQGKETTKIENKVYKVVARIYKDITKKELLFTHFQLVPSAIDTRNMKSWDDVQRVKDKGK